MNAAGAKPKPVTFSISPQVASPSKTFVPMKYFTAYQTNQATINHTAMIRKLTTGDPLWATPQ